METPPLTRGRRPRSDAGAVVLRNTPAYAGKTALFLTGPIMSRKHPRLRGED